MKCEKNRNSQKTIDKNKKAVLFSLAKKESISNGNASRLPPSRFKLKAFLNYF